MSDRRYFVVLGDDEIHEFAARDEAMRFWRAHLNKGVAVDPRVREALEAEVHNFTPARYRVIPEDRWIDITVQARVVLA